MLGLELIVACAPTVAPETILHIIEVESDGNPLAINVNNGPRVTAKNKADAIAISKRYIAAGYSVDMGLMQINSTNLSRLGYSVGDMFDACTNIAAGAEVLRRFYANASRDYGHGQGALLAALSAYNTGSMTRGFRNGYVQKYIGPLANPPAARHAPKRTPAPPAADPYTAGTVVYQRKEPTEL